MYYLGNRASIRSGHYGTTLTITDFMSADSGIYKCSACTLTTAETIKVDIYLTEKLEKYVTTDGFNNEIQSGRGDVFNSDIDRFNSRTALSRIYHRKLG